MASQRGAGILRRAAVGWIQKLKAGQNLLECEGHTVPFMLCARRWVATTMGQEAALQDAGLLMMLNSEIKNAKESHRQLKKFSRGPSKLFTVIDKPGMADMILTRQYGHEDIKLTCRFEPGNFKVDQDAEEEEYMAFDGVTLNTVHLTVSITKAERHECLELTCCCEQDDLFVTTVNLLNTEGLKAQAVGPEISQLDGDLQNHFLKFLKARGIDNNLSNYLLGLLEDKYSREYTDWLENLASFIKK
ncbi:hypothetical protein CY35_02G169200 [Sphagnum magellanicum]|jgi:complement component 1 Q subcomponent-binding protein|nr:hypothetical protein CY35_02G169200 [Sphagnum magellanicum]